MKTKFIVLFGFFVLLAAAQGADSSRWAIQSIFIIPQTSGNNTMSAVIVDNKNHHNIDIRDQVVLTKIAQSFVIDDKLILMGDAGKTQAVEIFDINQQHKIDWFFCYQPQRISESLLAYVEYYPSHSNAETTDVVLVYDLQRGPTDNRLIPAKTLPPGRYDYPVTVGIPVFPEYNVQHRTYDNTVDNPSDEYAVLGPPFFLMLSSKRLIFIASQGISNENSNTAESNIIISVDLSNGPTKPLIRKIAIPAELTSANDDASTRVEVTSMSEVDPFTADLHVPEQKYGLSSVQVHIPE